MDDTPRAVGRLDSGGAEDYFAASDRCVAKWTNGPLMFSDYPGLRYVSSDGNF